MKEEHIEADILDYLISQGVSCEKIVQEGYYDTNRGIYRKRKSQFIRNGSSDIHATLPDRGQGLFIEVKTPKDMSFFDVSSDTAYERLENAMERGLSKETLRRYQHSFEQSRYIEEKRSMGAIAFFASSIAQVEERLREYGADIY